MPQAQPQLMVEHKPGWIARCAIQLSLATPRCLFRLVLPLLVWAINNNWFVRVGGGQWQRVQMQHDWRTFIK